MHTYDLSGGGLCTGLVEALRADMLSGRLAAGEKLPSKRRLAEHHGISVQTVQNAYEQLIAEGYIVARERSGYYVAELEAPLARAEAASAPVIEEAERAWSLDLVANTTDASRFPFALWSRLSRRVLAEERDLLSPSPAAGVAALREAIATHLAEVRGIAVSPAQIVIGAGNEYLYQLLFQLFGRAHRYGLENPGHTKIARIAALYGAPFSPVSVDKGGVVIGDLVREGVDILHTSPGHHFPTGVLTPATRRAALLAWLAEGDRYIIEDDYDSEFRFRGKQIPPLFATDQTGRVIYMNTFSKTIAPSMRISFMVLPPELLSRYRAQLGFYACPVPVPTQYTLARFLSEGHFERHLHRMRTFYRARRDEVIAALCTSPFADRLTVKEADAGLHFLVKIKTAKSDAALRALLADAGIRAAFLEDYRIDGAHPDTHTVVFNYSGVSPDALRAGLARLAAKINEG